MMIPVTTWATFLFMIIEMVSGYVIAVVAILKNPAIANNQWSNRSDTSSFTPG